MSQERELTVKKLYLELENKVLKDNTNVVLEGWCRGNRTSSNVGFIAFNDGTYFKDIQLVYEKENENFDALSSIKYGSSIKAVGTIKLTPENKQPFEVVLSSFELLGDYDNDCPLQKKRHSFEFLRDIAYLRPRTNTFSAVYRVRNNAAYAIHKFFQEHSFMYVNTPLITSNDAEGAGQVFHVASDLKKPNEFFNSPACLTVSGQLHGEAFALAFRDIYTFGPTFRAENSNTSRHASEFWMIEPEMAFADIDDLMNTMESFLKYVINYVMTTCKDEMEFFNSFVDKTLLSKLTHVLNTPFRKVTYTEAIELLLKAQKEGVKFEYDKIEWGMDLQSEHERYLTEKVIKGPIFLIDFPKEIKAFYMKINKDNKTVAGVDLLVPGVGEICGGSQREENYDLLKERMDKIGNTKELEWYLNLRKYGGCIHSGFGLGFDRLLMYITGMQNIRDVQPFPRTPGSLKY